MCLTECNVYTNEFLQIVFCIARNQNDEIESSPWINGELVTSNSLHSCKSFCSTDYLARSLKLCKTCNLTRTVPGITAALINSLLQQQWWAFNISVVRRNENGINSKLLYFRPSDFPATLISTSRKHQPQAINNKKHHTTVSDHNLSNCIQLQATNMQPPNQSNANERHNDYIEQQVHICQQALEAWTQESHPKNWASTQCKLGDTLQINIPTDWHRDYIEESIECYQLALQIWTRESSPENWATTQNNMGNSFINRISGDRKEQIDSAIK